MGEIIFSSKVCYICFAYRAVDKRISSSPLSDSSWFTEHRHDQSLSTAASFYHHSVCWNNTTALCVILTFMFWRTFFIFFGLKEKELPSSRWRLRISYNWQRQEVSDAAIQSHDDTPGGPRCGVLSHVLSGRLSGATQPCCDWNDPSHTVCLHRTAHSPK